MSPRSGLPLCWLCDTTSLQRWLPVGCVWCATGIRASPGIAGEGIYGFEVPTCNEEALTSPSPELAAAWSRTTTGGYNAGVGIAMRCHGVLIKGDSNLVIPAGAAAKKNDQFAAAPGTVSYLSVTFNLPVLLGHIDKWLRENGYSVELHNALLKVKKYIDDPNRPAVPPAGAVFLTNVLVSTVPIGRRTKESVAASSADDAWHGSGVAASSDPVAPVAGDEHIDRPPTPASHMSVDDLGQTLADTVPPLCSCLHRRRCSTTSCRHSNTAATLGTVGGGIPRGINDSAHGLVVFVVLTASGVQLGSLNLSTATTSVFWKHIMGCAIWATRI